MPKTINHLLAQESVRTAIINTKNILPTLWVNLLEQRLQNDKGGYYPQFHDKKMLCEAIKRARWEETHHGRLEREHRLFIAQLPGVFGLIRIENAPSDAVFVAKAFGNRGDVFLTTKHPQIIREKVNTTYLKTKLFKGIEVVCDLQPGEPIVPTVVKEQSLIDGVCMTRTRALAYGFVWSRWQKS